MFKFIHGKKPTELQLEIQKLKEELEKCRFLIERNDTLFNMSTDENLIAAQIYERESLRWQYCYLLNLIKEKENSCIKTQKVQTGE
jgi:hypothetical protein